MSHLKTAVHNDLQILQMAHDEIALQAHLFKADAKAKWSELESKWADLKSHIEKAAAAGETAENEAATAVKLLSETLRNGYDNIRKALKN
jgi:hypothetical protein